MSNLAVGLGTSLSHTNLVVPATVRNEATLRLWTPAQGRSGLVVVARAPSLAAVVAGQIVEVETGFGQTGSHAYGGRVIPVNLGGLQIVGSSRQKEPARVIGHPDLASGASVQRGDILYVSVAEAIYRETRGENVEVHLTPTAEDNEALSDLRQRARHRWDSDRLPDGWTRPLPTQPVVPRTPAPDKDRSVGVLPEDLRALAQRIQAKDGEGQP